MNQFVDLSVPYFIIFYILTLITWKKFYLFAFFKRFICVLHTSQKIYCYVCNQNFKLNIIASVANLKKEIKVC